MVQMDHMMAKVCEEVEDGAVIEVVVEVDEEGEVIEEETMEVLEAVEGAGVIIVIEAGDVAWAIEETTDLHNTEKLEIIEIVGTRTESQEIIEMLGLKETLLPETPRRSITGRKIQFLSRGEVEIESPNLRK